MASTDALPVPRKNAAFRLYLGVYDTSGNIITGGITGADSEVSKDGGAFADCTNEFTEIGTSGVGYLELTSTEMNADSVVVTLKVTNTDAVDNLVTLYPEEAGDVRVNLTQINSDSSLIAKFAAAVGGNKVGTLTGAQTATTLTASTPDDATADLYNGRFLLMLTGALAGKATKITDYSESGGNGVFTVESLGTGPSSGDTFLIL